MPLSNCEKHIVMQTTRIAMLARSRNTVIETGIQGLLFKHEQLLSFYIGVRWEKQVTLTFNVKLSLCRELF